MRRGGGGEEGKGEGSRDEGACRAAREGEKEGTWLARRLFLFSHLAQSVATTATSSSLDTILAIEGSEKMAWKPAGVPSAAPADEEGGRVRAAQGQGNEHRRWKNQRGDHMALLSPSLITSENLNACNCRQQMRGRGLGNGKLRAARASERTRDGRERDRDTERERTKATEQRDVGRVKKRKKKKMLGRVLEGFHSLSRILLPRARPGAAAAPHVHCEWRGQWLACCGGQWLWGGSWRKERESEQRPNEGRGLASDHCFAQEFAVF